MRALPILLAALALTAPAAAQDGSEAAAARSVESAQRFLAETIGGARIPVTVPVRLIAETYQPGFRVMNAGEGFPASGETESWIATERCKSVLTVTNVRPAYVDQIVPYDAPPRVMRFEFDWSRVDGATATESPYNVSVRSSTGEATARTLYSAGASYDNAEPMLPGFYFSTLEKAKRVVFAMEYLKDNCAVKSDTGF